VLLLVGILVVLLLVLLALLIVLVAGALRLVQTQAEKLIGVDDHALEVERLFQELQAIEADVLWHGGAVLRLEREPGAVVEHAGQRCAALRSQFDLLMQRLVLLAGTRARPAVEHHHPAHLAGHHPLQIRIRCPCPGSQRRE